MAPSRHNLTPENDERARRCRVELHRRPIVGIIGYHWALYFRWEDGYDMHYEATDVDKRLIARCGRGKPEQTFDTLVMDLGTKVLSPKRVNLCARENPHNGALYILTKMNCQVWAKQLASDLGITIPITVNILKYIPGSELLDGIHLLSGSGSGSSKSSSRR
ncbi:uncharacterized protein [Macrobrachium rosenbergii]|uniref:uncharacterized protein isoform X5 n=1 Tax=Macrobrachium rosenbergii TaxID=79674 RepID=UPI0034D3F987